MGADNWTVCPSCAKHLPDPSAPDPRTFREDHEFWLDARVDPPVVFYSYEGKCKRCGSGVKFSGEVPVAMKIPNG